MIQTQCKAKIDNGWKIPLGHIKGIGGSRPKKVFVHFDICYSPIFLLSKMGSYVSQLSKLYRSMGV